MHTRSIAWRRAPDATGQEGFSLWELLIVMTIIIILSAIGLSSYYAFEVRQRDSERREELHLFSSKLEQFRQEKGYYVCGDTCQGHYGQDAKYYVVDCSVYEPNGVIDNTIDDPKQISGFLNGGDCCALATTQGKPAFPLPDPYVPSDPIRWGLYYHGYLDTERPQDPLAITMEYNSYEYCYAAPADGRKAYALFARMENSEINSQDGGICPTWYELYSPGYPADGWNPSMASLGC